MEAVSSQVRLESARLIIRDMQRGDLERVELWRPYHDPLHKLWHIPPSSSLSRDIWFVLHGSDPSRMWFAIERCSDAQVIGILSLREIVRPVSARLGIRLGANFIDRGYGTEALRVFVPYCLHSIGLCRIVLDVAAVNPRAMHVYEKMGFRRTGQHYRNVPADQDLSFLEDERYCDLRRFFRRHLGHMQLLFYDMSLESGDWDRGAKVQA